jgi:hypothetical protein
MPVALREILTARFMGARRRREPRRDQQSPPAFGGI